ncbi:hypothetical protein JHD46_07225 [Sulfurimonas sp. SAG-AH-194-C20]|nr:hypothetical protein [Sulfurimonas sp. SAG-AH-194-C20]MDF1879425.1 hypothetical protein [Sulfurimonas sp. SAG-AH-194-C20]
MIKKIALITILLSSLSYGAMIQKGLIVGIDTSITSSNINYAKNGSGITTSNYSAGGSLSPVSLKVGYQYYFTRIYGRISTQYEYNDNKLERYKIKNQVFELNTDYIPIIYKGDNSWHLRGIFGVGVGANKSSLVKYDDRLDSIGINLVPILNKETQWNMEYGFELGLLLEFDFGLGAELGYRVRSGLMGEFSDEDGANEVTFKLQTSEVYLGVNYLF